MIIKIERGNIEDAYKNGDFSGCEIRSKDFKGKVWSKDIDFTELPEYEPLEMTMDIRIKPGQNGLSVGVQSLNAKRLTTASQPQAKGASK